MRHPRMHRFGCATVGLLALAALSAACDPRAPQTPPLERNPPATTPGTATTPLPPASAASN
jgi:hypothetical protein